MPSSRDRLTRDRIIAAARLGIEAAGHEKLSLRKLAADLEVTAPALYDHVASKDELLRLVAEQGYAELGDASVPTATKPIDRVRSRAAAYVTFAQTHPEVFRVMFLYRPAAVAIEADNELNAASDVYDLGLADLEAAIADGDLVDRDPAHLGLVMWAAVHGIATVSLIAPPVGAAVATDVVDAMLAGLRPD
ncbi:TetR/AcrR family transcriptional regulator [Ilumatobacter coccineus]|uniref:Putative TetR family transcriptional regulator n=1 Tax=Ilumatobacter coccineus (strain NBRC 103263 / KCTC 29153 / YM16-304) TaxID=1313172 RepID=A0A6C7E049_ILUCY|nr:TetR/AcrR family transcriptional regulator [Ilumatobacter coccineus]BAN00403.1 putative TetR family transcriptional regulator [Ilumatobacter coccineus YM16-304]